MVNIIEFKSWVNYCEIKTFKKKEKKLNNIII